MLQETAPLRDGNTPPFSPPQGNAGGTSLDVGSSIAGGGGGAGGAGGNADHQGPATSPETVV